MLSKIYLEKINGNIALIQKPIYQELTIINGGKIQCLSIPSPGSPFRKLDTFSYPGINQDKYINNYLKAAFEWLML